MYSKTVEVEGVSYQLSAVKVRQLRELQETRTANPAFPIMNDSIQLVAYCLENARLINTNPDPLPWDIARVEDLALPIYNKLRDAAQEVSGFVEKPAEGEAKAALTTV